MAIYAKITYDYLRRNDLQIIRELWDRQRIPNGRCIEVALAFSGLSRWQVTSLPAETLVERLIESEKRST
jgi:hypothetical protein